MEELQENAQIDIKRREQPPKLLVQNADISRQHQPLLSHEGQTTISMFSVKHDPDDSISVASDEKRKSESLLALKKVVEEREAELRLKTNTILTECTMVKDF